jgi:hypothetical protein
MRHLQLENSPSVFSQAIGIINNTSLSDSLSAIAIIVASLALIVTIIGNRSSGRQIDKLNQSHREIVQSQAAIASSNIDKINQGHIDNFMDLIKTLSPLFTELERTAINTLDQIGSTLDTYDSAPQESGRLRHQIAIAYREIVRLYGPELTTQRGLHLLSRLGFLKYIFDGIDSYEITPNLKKENIFQKVFNYKSHTPKTQKRISPEDKIQSSSCIHDALKVISNRIPAASIADLNTRVTASNSEYLNILNRHRDVFKSANEQLKGILGATKYRGTPLKSTLLGLDIETLQQQLEVIVSIGRVENTFFRGISTPQYLSNLVHLTSVIYIVSQRSMWGRHS